MRHPARGRTETSAARVSLTQQQNKISRVGAVINYNRINYNALTACYEPLRIGLGTIIWISTIRVWISDMTWWQGRAVIIRQAMGRIADILVVVLRAITETQSHLCCSVVLRRLLGVDIDNEQSKSAKRPGVNAVNSRRKVTSNVVVPSGRSVNVHATMSACIFWDCIWDTEVTSDVLWEETTWYPSSEATPSL